MSKDHKKVYQLLKYFIHGHGNSVDIGHSLDKQEYSSYILKTLIIRHHDSCKELPGQLGPCLLALLEDICKFENTENLPMLSKQDKSRENDNKKLFLRPFLEHLKDDLKSIALSSTESNFDGLTKQQSLAISVNAKYKNSL